MVDSIGVGRGSGGTVGAVIDKGTLSGSPIAPDIRYDW